MGITAFEQELFDVRVDSRKAMLVFKLESSALAAILTGRWRRSREDLDTGPTRRVAVMHMNRVLAIDHMYEDIRKAGGATGESGVWRLLLISPTW